MACDLEALARLLRLAPESQTAADADEEGRRLEAFALELATGNETAGDDRSLTETFRALVQGRVLSTSHRLIPGASGAANPGSVLRVVQCVRLLLRHPRFVDRLLETAGAVKALGDKFRTYADLHRADIDVVLGDAPRSEDETPVASDENESAAPPLVFRDEILSELASVFKKVAASRGGASAAEDDSESHRVAIALLSTRDHSLLASALVILKAATSLKHAASEPRASEVARSDCAFHLLAMLRAYHSPFDRLAADVLHNLCGLREGREGIRAAGGVRATLELVASEDPRGDVDVDRAVPSDSRNAFGKKTLALRVLCGLLRDRAAAVEARAAGAPSIVAAMLRSLSSRPDRDHATHAESVVSSICHSCSALTRLAADDDGGEAVARADGVFALGRVLVDRRETTRDASSSPTRVREGDSREDASSGSEEHVESSSLGSNEAVFAHVFRALRFVFGCERERVRGSFKRLFPPEMFARFIDVGHFQNDIGAYRRLAVDWCALDAGSVQSFARALDDVALARRRSPGGPPEKDAAVSEPGEASVSGADDLESGRCSEPQTRAVRVVRGYALTECLGEGAFGRVHRAHKVAGRGSGTADVFGGSASGRFDPPLRAVKEMFLRTDQNAHAVTSEVRILARLQHPNIVRYAESFVERDTVFIVMELASGASLGERVAGFVSAGERAPERFLWDVFSQTCQALRYLHDEAGVIHRDITPSNILVDRDNRRVKLVDFGLAKSLESSSAVSSFASFASIASIASTASVSDPGSAPPRAEPTRDPAARSGVGTMPYSCPEIIKNEPYDAKADVWSFGCVMYHAIALRPPFGGSRSNPLAVASRIVEGRFDPLAGAASGDSAYSDDLIDAVSSMLIVDPASRPSIATVAAGRVHRAMRETDRLREENDALREELTNERRRREFESSMERRRRDAAVTAARLGFDGFGRIEAPRDSAREALRVDPSGGSEVIRGPQTECSPLSPLALSRGSVKIAPRRLRPVHDPAAEIISALHKLAFADRLPPSAQRDARRASVRRFAAYVFSAARSAGAVKAETVKLARGSPEPTLASSAGGARGAAETYEDVSRALEEVLLEHGYYALARAESR